MHRLIRDGIDTPLAQLVGYRTWQILLRLFDYLTTLIELGYVLDYPLLRFWFRFVFPQNSLIARLGPTVAMERLIKPGLNSYFGLCFELLCREALPMIYAREGATTAFEVGEYWDKDTQIDIVGLRKDGITDLGECKWTSTKSPTPLRKALEPRSAIYQNARRATLHLRYFTRVKVTHRTPPLRDEHWHDLADIYDVKSVGS